MFECMVRAAKSCLHKTIGQAHFSRDELLTAIVEIEGVINSRPQSYVSSYDLEEPLTPHLIVGEDYSTFQIMQDYQMTLKMRNLKLMPHTFRKGQNT